MIDIRWTVRLLGRDRQTVDAQLRPAGKEDIERWHDQWQPPTEDRGFPWDHYLLNALTKPETQAAYVVDLNGSLEGLRWLVHSGHPDRETLGVWNCALATAPWNEGATGRWRGVGSALVAAAIEVSLRVGLGGRIFCQPLAKAATFHERNGMTAIPGDPLGRVRMDEEAARTFLLRLRQERTIP